MADDSELSPERIEQLSVLQRRLGYEFRNIDLPRILAAVATPPRFLDCRNIYDPREMQDLGFEYVSIGRPRLLPGEPPQEDVSTWALSSRFSSLRS